MNNVVLIIGFSYKNLTSTITDIYQAYSYFRLHSYDIRVCSDVIDPINIQNYIEVMIHNEVDDQFTKFVQHQFHQIKDTVVDKDSLLGWFSSIRNSFRDINKLIVYYTGHGVDNHLVLPDNSHFSSLEFRSSILSLVQPDKSSEVLVIMDCCSPSGLYLPFRFDSNKSRYEHINNNFIKPNVIVIASSDNTSESRATLSHSPFTSELFSYLRDQTQSYDIKSIIYHLNQNTRKFNQQAVVYSSYPSLIMLWSWIMNSKIQIQINHQLHSIMISKHENRSNSITISS